MTKTALHVRVEGIRKKKGADLQRLDRWSGIGTVDDFHTLKQVVELQQVGLTD